MRIGIVCTLAWLTGCSIAVANAENDLNTGGNATPAFASAVDRPAECVVEPSRPDQPCIDDEIFRCLRLCDFDDTGGPQCGPEYRLCVEDAPNKCPPLPEVTEQTKCGDCRFEPATLMTCRAPVGQTSVTFVCNAATASAFEDKGYQCGPCQYVQPPGEYRRCSCGGEGWKEYCPPENLAEAPAIPFCQRHPERCLVRD